MLLNQELQMLLAHWVCVSMLIDIAIIVSVCLTLAICMHRQNHKMKQLYLTCIAIQQTQKRIDESRAVAIQSVSNEVHTTSTQLSENTRKIREQLKELADKKLNTHITINNK